MTKEIKIYTESLLNENNLISLYDYTNHILNNIFNYDIKLNDLPKLLEIDDINIPYSLLDIIINKNIQKMLILNLEYKLVTVNDDDNNYDDIDNIIEDDNISKNKKKLYYSKSGLKSIVSYWYFKLKNNLDNTINDTMDTINPTDPTDIFGNVLYENHNNKIKYIKQCLIISDYYEKYKLEYENKLKYTELYSQININNNNILEYINKYNLKIEEFELKIQNLELKSKNLMDEDMKIKKLDKLEEFIKYNDELKSKVDNIDKRTYEYYECYETYK